MKTALSLSLLICLLSACSHSDQYVVQGYYLNGKEQYMVEAVGLCKENVKNTVKSRNIAKEAAVILAQKKVMDEFNIPQGRVVRSGLIKNVQFIDNRTCKILYLVNVKDLK